MHRNFKSSNILLDDDLSVHVSECGLAALISSGSVSQVRYFQLDRMSKCSIPSHFMLNHS